MVLKLQNYIFIITIIVSSYKLNNNMFKAFDVIMEFLNIIFGSPSNKECFVLIGSFDCYSYFDMHFC